jgi:hypothetical protein
VVVNIAAAMEVLELDIAHRPKMALLVLACHADRTTASATVSIERLAGELGVAYGTAWRALQGAIAAGYLEAEPVDNHPSKPRVWHLRSRADARPRSRDYDDEVARLAPKGRALARDLRIFKEKREGARSTLAHREAAIVGAVDNVNGNGASHHHPDSCPCGGTGWLAGADATVTRCLEVAK